MKRNKFIVDCAILCSLTIVLQLLSTLLTNTLQVSLTLALVPTAIACIHYGAKCGLIVSAAMGITLFIECAVGFEVSGNVMFMLSPFRTFFGSAVRVIFAACCLIAVVFATKKFEGKKWRTVLLSALLPFFNTAVFIVAFVTLFNPLLHEWANAAGADAVTFIFLGLVGVNFIIEVITCTVLCPVIISALEKLKN